MKRKFLHFAIILNSFSALAQYSGPIPISPNSEIFANAEWSVPADMDNDGDMDIVSASASDDYPVWLENLDGNGEYSNPIRIGNPLFGYTRDLHVIDFDNDDDMDIVIVKYEKIYWYKNTLNPSQRFEDAILLPLTPTGAQKIQMVDLNGDQLLDVLYLGLYNHIGWLERIDLQGNFYDYQLITDELYSEAIHAADIDGDGDMDIIPGKYPNHNIAWLKNIDGSGTFSAPLFIGSEQNNIDFITTADLDGDDDMDVITSDTWANQIKWYENLDGSGNFSETKILIDTAISLSHPYIVDIDDDQDLDIVVSFSSHLNVIENTDGQGNFEVAGKIFDLYYVAEDIQSADINNDGYKDLITTTNGSTSGREQMAIFINKGDNSFENPVDILSDADRLKFLNSFDIDSDGKPEMITGHDLYGRLTWREFNNSPLKFKNPHLIGTGFDESYNPEHLVDFGDFDNDGDQDILYLFGVDRIVWYEKLDGEKMYSERKTIFKEDYGFNSLAAIDVDGDENIDVFFIKTGGSANKGLHWCKNIDGTGEFEDPVKINPDNNHFSNVIPVDFDGDNDIDFLCHEYSVISWYQNQDSVFAENQVLIEIPDQVFQLVFGDVDSDGQMDIVYRNNNTVSWRKNLGNNSFGDAMTYYLDPELIETIKVIDIDYDGDLDVFAILNGYKLALLENLDGFGNFSNAIPIEGDFNQLTRFYFEDFDGDNDLDMFSYSFSEDMLFMHENLLNAVAINGVVYLDTNENGNFDLDEQPLFLQPIEIQPDALAVFSNQFGIFHFALDNGSYTLNCNPSNGFSLTTPQEVDVEITGDEVIEVTFGLKAEFDLLNGFVVTTSGPTRCGFEVPFWLDFQNTGTVIADGYIELELDTLVSIVEINPAPDSISGNFLYWYFEDLNPTYSGQIFMILQMPGVEHLGEEISLVSSIYLTSDDGSQYTIFGHGYRSTINCSYDPNDKLVEPSFPNHDNYTLFGDTLDYTVRFQNTGTDTAFTVRIEDYLDPNLDWSSLRIQGASHDYEVTLDQRSGRLLFVFNNILLPDSTTNEVASHGFVRFHLLHKEDLPELTYIRNSSNIYFDFNTPVETNTVYNILVSEYPLLIELTPPSCYGDSDGRIDILFNIPYYESFEWSNGQTGPSAENLSAGEYQLLITTVNGEIIDTSITLFGPLQLSVGEPQIHNITCFGLQDGNILVKPVGGTPGFSIEWSSGTFGQFIDNLTAGLYYITVTDAKGCFIEEALGIAEPQEELFLVDLELIHVSCFGNPEGIISVNATGGVPGYNFEWSNGTTGPINEQLIAGEYTLTLTDTYGCSIIQTYIIETAEPIPFQIQNLGHVTCFGFDDGFIHIDSVGVSPNTTFEWSNGVLGLINEQLIAGEYFLTVTDTTGCSNEHTFIITEPDSISLITLSSPEIENNMNGSVTVEVSGGTPPYTYSWELFPLEMENTLSNLSAGEYSMTVTDANGCTSETSIFVDHTTSINTTNYEIYFSIDPNPSTGHLSIKFDLINPKKWQIKIHNGIGQLTHRFDSSDSNSSSENLSVKMPEGLYSVSLFVEGKILRTEMVIILK